MGLFSRRKLPAAGDDVDENLLVISDIHLGEDILDEGPPTLGEYIRALNRELAQFIQSHRQKNADDRPWHLVVNGDMFDFLKVTDRRDSFDGKVREQVLTPIERARDLVNTKENVLWKLERVLEVHRPLFKEMAAFLLDGHRITLLEGNHDAEFYFPEVRDKLRQALVALAEQRHQQERKKGPFDPEAVSQRLSFRTWFLANAGRFHIEHGHQYDAYCSFEYHLAPYDRAEKNTLATPVSHRTVPYVADLLGDFSTHGVDDFSLPQLLRELGRRGGWRTLWTIFKLYFGVGIELVRRAGPRRRVELRAHAAEHEQRLKELALEAPYGLSTLRRLDALKATPVEFSLLKVMQLFYFDRIAVGLGVVSGAAVALFLNRGPGLVLLGASLVLGSGLMWLAGLARKQDLHGKLRLAASRIADVTGSRYVVFGHSHQPELVDLSAQYGVQRFGERAYYINSGSWVTREILRGEAGSGMTYVEITRRGAALLRWLGPVQAPAVLSAAREAETPPELAKAGA